MMPDQIDARKKKMREYNIARLSGVAMTDVVMSDTEDEQMLVNMTSVTPHSLTPPTHEEKNHGTQGLSDVTPTNKFMHDDQGRMQHEQEGQAHAKIKNGIYSCVLTRFFIFNRHAFFI
ncbi:unnamed protein product [Alopecurus aequalis]